jgi:hypothetical protein
MTAPAREQAPAKESAFPTIRITAGQTLLLDVDTCDVVAPMQPTEPPALRLKGRVIGGHGLAGDRAQVFLPIEMVEGSMTQHLLLRAPIPELPRGESAREVKLTRRRVAVTKLVGRHQITSWDVRPHDGLSAPEILEEQELVRDYRWALIEARALVEGQADGYAVGFEDVREVAERLLIERRRSRQGRN